MADRSFGILVELKDRFTKPLRGLTAPIENAKRELKSLEQAGRDLTWAEKYQGQLDKLQPSLSAARENQAKLAAEIAATENPSKRLLAQFEKANRKLSELEAREHEYTAALEQARESLRQAGVDTEDLAQARSQLAERTDQARAKTLLFNNALRAVNVRDTANQYKTLASHLLVLKTAMAAVTAAVVGLAPHLAKIGAAYGMTLATFASTAQVSAVTKEMLKLSETTGASTQALQEWRFAARFEGMDTDLGEFGDVGKIFQDIAEKTKALGTKDGEDFAVALQKIGLKSSEIKKLKPDEVMMRLGAALNKSKLSGQQQVELLNEISDGYGNLLPLIRNYGTQMTEIRDYANQVGAIQTPAQLERMKQTTRELSFWKLGLEGVMVRLSAVGSNVVNTLGPNVRQLFIDAQTPIAEWSAKVDVALKRFKAEWDRTGSLGEALKLSFKAFYPTLSGFLSGAAQFGRGYGDAFIAPMLDSLKKGYARIGEAMGSGGGIEAKGRALGEAMRPMTAIVDEVANAVAFLIENVRYLKSISDFTPLGMLINSLSTLRSILDVVGEGVKKFGQALGLIDPNSQSSGFSVLLGTLMALAAAAFANKLALGLLGAGFSALRFALSPLMPVLSVLRFGLLFLSNPIGRLAAIFGVLQRALIVVRIAFAVLSVAIRANPIGLAITAIAMGAMLIYRNWEAIAGFFKNLWSRVTATFTQFRARIAGMSWGQIALTIAQGFASLPAKLFQIAVQAIGQLAIGILSKLGLIDSNTARIMQSMVDSFANLPSKLMDIGMQAMAGLANGIMSAGKRALDAAKAIASEIGSSIKGFFDIRSPSRLMHGYGANISQGLAVGIMSNQHAAVRSANQLAEKVRAGVVVSLADARKARASRSALPVRESLRDALINRASNHAGKQEVGGEIRVKLDVPAHVIAAAKVSKPSGQAVGITANVGRVSW